MVVELNIRADMAAGDYSVAFDTVCAYFDPPLCQLASPRRSTVTTVLARCRFDSYNSPLLRTYYSNTNSMGLSLFTDSVATASGWTATWRAIPAGIACATHLTPPKAPIEFTSRV